MNTIEQVLLRRARLARAHANALDRLNEALTARLMRTRSVNTKTRTKPPRTLAETAAALSAE